ncbi:MAG: hypothetical protein LQ340_006805 [Diploschistes diacapsis]|nr:MAG: hypothetical protein LQ340_006805 [Diploschistes diacapsis]
MDFRQPLEQLASVHVCGIRELIDFSSGSAYGAHLFFVSSVGAVMDWQPRSDDANGVPEEAFESWDVAEPTGYSRAKPIAERVITAACSGNCTQISATICRIGQIAGPMSKAGQGPKHEWLPSIIASSKTLGSLPASLRALDTVDWMPVDIVGMVVVNLAKSSSLARYRECPGVFHVVNPSKTTWKMLLPVSETYLGTGAVPASEWLGLLRTSAESVEPDMKHNPALKLLDFLEDALSEQRTSPLPLAVSNNVD